jgi:hypothetical protein
MSDLREVIDYLCSTDDEAMGEMIHKAGMVAGDQVSQILKSAAMSMPSTASAIGMAVHVTAQMLVETIQFGERSMSGARDDERTIRAAALQMFVDLVNEELPAALARPS